MIFTKELSHRASEMPLYPRSLLFPHQGEFIISLFTQRPVAGEEIIVKILSLSLSLT